VPSSEDLSSIFEESCEDCGFAGFLNFVHSLICRTEHVSETGYVSIFRLKRWGGTRFGPIGRANLFGLYSSFA
jgi:hypothetical protein